MKINVQNRPAVFTRSMLALGLGCTLAALPLGTASAQDSSSTAPRATGTVDPAVPASERPKLTGDEVTFLKTAAGGNAAEVMMAKLALKNGESQGVKEFAHHMIADHGKANMELEALAKRSNVTDFAPTPSAEDKAIYDKLATLKGKAFDEAYIKNAVTDHSKDLDEYKQAHNQVTSKDLLHYVEQTEPIVAGHLKMAKEMEKSETKG